MSTHANVQSNTNHQGPATTGEKHILLVEDNEGDILLTSEALCDGHIPHTLAVVKDGLQAIQYLEKKGKFISEPRPDLVLLDINLPKMNGHEVLKAMQSNKNIKDIPVIMLSTSSSEKDILISLQNNAFCYITKPIELEHFCEVILSIH